MPSRLTAWAVAAVLAATASATAGDWPAIQKRGVIKVIAAADEDPMMFSFRPGSSPGFERELIEGFAALHKLTVEPVAAKTYEERIPALTRGDGDVVIGMIVTEARKKLVDFTSEVLPARHVVVSHQRTVRTVEEFKAEKVGLLKGTTWAQAAFDAGLPAGDAEMFTDREQMLEALTGGRISATVMSVSDAALAIKKHPSLQAGAFVGAAVSAAWGIRKQDDQLEAALNDYLENARKSGAWGRLIVKYFGEKALTVLGRDK